MRNFIEKLFNIPVKKDISSHMVEPTTHKFHASNVHIGDMLKISDEHELVTVRRVFGDDCFLYGIDGYKNYTQIGQYDIIIANYGTKESRRRQ